MLFVFVPFYRQWARFEKDAGPLGVFLLSLIVPILFTVFFFLAFTYFTPLGDFEHPAYSWVSVRPVIMFAAFFGTSGVLFVVSWADVGIWLTLAAPAHTRAKSRRVATAIAVVFVVACSMGSIQALAAAGIFFFSVNFVVCGQ